MLVSEMRRKVKDVYGNSTWDRKVDNMPDNQVIAIFYSMKESGKLKNKKRKKSSYHQIDLFECFGIDQKVG